MSRGLPSQGMPCVAALALILSAPPAGAGTVCVLVADARTAAVVLERGDCRARVTPASTFKIALSVMGFESGVLSGPDAPSLPFKPGYADWLGDAWKQPTDPARWMKYSVVWFSQQIAQALGTERLQGFARSFGYGNADFSGDPGKGNGLERAWIGSSLTISPAEQVAFLARLVNRELPVSRQAVDRTLAIVETARTAGGWEIAGKTGSAFPRRADGSLDRARGWGWFVGWARKDGRTLVFARLDQDATREKTSGGVRARGALVQGWDRLLAARP